MIYLSELVHSQDFKTFSESAKSPVVVCEEVIQQTGLEERHELAKSLRSQQVRIPDLHSLLQAWPEAINVDLPALRIDVDQTLERH